jgi:hypothetical protein
VLGGQTSFHTRSFGLLNDYLQRLNSSGFYYHFYSAIIALHNGQRTEAEGFVDTARDVLRDDASLLTESAYERVYPLIFKAQLLVEFEEIRGLGGRRRGEEGEGGVVKL